MRYQTKSIAVVVLAIFQVMLIQPACQKKNAPEPEGPSIGGPNRPPLALAGDDFEIQLPLDSAVLDASSSTDPNNNIASYAWKQLSGNTDILIQQASSVKCRLKNLQIGRYSFELKVVDSLGLFDHDTVSLNVVKSKTEDPGCYEMNSNYWVAVQPIPNMLSSEYYAGMVFPGGFGAAASSNELVFFAGGHEEGTVGFCLNTVLVFNPTGAGSGWEQKTLRLSEERSHLAGAGTSNYAVFAGGNNLYTGVWPPPYGINLLYSDRIDIFSSKDFSITNSTLSEARSDLAAASLDEKVYLMGGKTESGYSKKIDILDPASGVISTQQMPRSRGFGGAVAYGKNIYLAGGVNENGYVYEMDIFNTATNSWSTEMVPNAHPNATVSLVMNKIVIAGGDGKSLNFVDIYNVETRTWTTVELSDSRFGMAAAVANNRLVLVGGNYSCHVDVYDAVSNRWFLTKLNKRVNGVSGVSNGKVCMFAGFLYDNGFAIPSTVISIDPS